MIKELMGSLYSSVLACSHCLISLSIISYFIEFIFNCCLQKYSDNLCFCCFRYLYYIEMNLFRHRDFLYLIDLIFNFCLLYLPIPVLRLLLSLSYNMSIMKLLSIFTLLSYASSQNNRALQNNFINLIKKLNN